MRQRRLGAMQVKQMSIHAAILAGCFYATFSVAQVPLKLPTDHAGIVALHTLQEKEEMEFRKAFGGQDAGEEIDSLPQFIPLHAEFLQTRGGVSNAAYAFSSYFKKDHPDAKTWEPKLLAVQAAIKASVPSFYVGVFDTEIASIVAKRDVDLSTAETLAQSGVALYNHDDCLQDDRFAAESHHVYDESRAKHPVPFTYHAEEGEENCAQALASRYAILGKIETKRGDVDAATASFQMALKKYANVDAALGLATIDKAKGDEAGELEMFNVAFLTGAVSTEDVKAARALYAKLNPGSKPLDYDTLLDARFAKTFANPVANHAAGVASAASQHVVLDELFTGADCEPCVAPDLATEALLRRYDRDKVVVAVYHDNAPGPDPLTTDVSEARAKYYGTGDSTPHVIVDGKELEIEEGSPSHAQSSFDILTKAIDPLLSAQAKAELHLTSQIETSQLHGDFLHVTVSGNASGLPAKTHLQILLLETEISDSGKNTLRFQPMVVRAAATSKTGELGLILKPTAAFSMTYTFDLKKAEADNLAYYDHYREELETRMAAFVAKGAMNKAEIDARAQFREPKNLIHPDRLAVVAFLQADDTRKVFQSTYTAVVAAQEGEKQ
jgi:hypothetical protein